MKRKREWNGFTLIELLIVVAIIAVLISILAPALQSARDQARSVVCFGNLRSLSVGWQMYATANKDQIVGGHVGVRKTNPNYYSEWWYAWVEFPQNEQGIYTGYNLGGGYPWRDTPLEDKIRGIKNGLLYPYVNNLDAYHCKSDWRLHENSRFGKEPAWRSYTIAAGFKIPSYDAVNVNKYSHIQCPEAKYVFVENLDVRGWNMGYWDIFAPSHSEAKWWNYIASWHRDRCNWGFADGHAETQRWQDERTVLISNELDYDKQTAMRDACSFNPPNPDLLWIVDRRMNDW